MGLDSSSVLLTVWVTLPLQVLEPEQDRQSNPDDPWAHVSDQPGSLASADALSAQVRTLVTSCPDIANLQAAHWPDLSLVTSHLHPPSPNGSVLVPGHVPTRMSGLVQKSGSPSYGRPICLTLH